MIPAHSSPLWCAEKRACASTNAPGYVASREVPSIRCDGNPPGAVTSRCVRGRLRRCHTGRPQRHRESDTEPTSRLRACWALREPGCGKCGRTVVPALADRDTDHPLDHQPAPGTAAFLHAGSNGRAGPSPMRRTDAAGPRHPARSFLASSPPLGETASLRLKPLNCQICCDQVEFPNSGSSRRTMISFRGSTRPHRGRYSEALIAPKHLLTSCFRLPQGASRSEARPAG